MADKKRILVLGATSAIAEHWCRRRAATGDRLLLVGRDRARLDAVSADLKARGAEQADVATDDLVDPVGAGGRFDAWVDRLDGLDLVLVAYGVLGDQDEAQRDDAALADILVANFNSAVLWCELAARRFEGQGSGCLVAISSVAGDRGRRTNYVYGAAKAGLSTYLEGLAHRFSASDVDIVCIKPGFVATPMTAHIDGRGGALWATPDQVAADIDKAIAGSRPVAYTPWFWRWIMLIIRHLPRFVFNRMKI